LALEASSGLEPFLGLPHFFGVGCSSGGFLTDSTLQTSPRALSFGTLSIGSR